MDLHPNQFYHIYNRSNNNEILFKPSYSENKAMTLISNLIRTIMSIALGCLFILSCRTNTSDTRVPKLNSLPMYGNLPLSSGYQQANKEFILFADSIFDHDRTKASQYYCKHGWDYFRSGFLDTAMFRFNQAWLLDTTNGRIYWGFADVLSKKGQYNEAVPFFKRAIKAPPNNSILWREAALTQGQLFFQTKDIQHLRMSIDYSMQAIHFDPSNANAYGDLATAYSYFIQKDSAIKYMHLADKLDPKVVNPEVRKLLTGKQNQ